MKCLEREKLFQLIHGMLEPQPAEEARAHLAACGECSRMAEEYQRLDAALDDWIAAEPSPWFDARLRARVASATARDSWFRLGRVRVLAAAVAAVVVILAAVVVFHHQQVVENHHSVISQQQPNPAAAQPSEPTEALRQPVPPDEQLKMDENLSLLEDYDVVSNFDALSELPQAKDN